MKCGIICILDTVEFSGTTNVIRTAEGRRSPVNYCTLLAAFVRISCNSGTETFTVSTKMAIACVGMAVFDKGCHINLKNMKES